MLGKVSIEPVHRDHDRDAQFPYLAGQVGEHVAAGQPVVSVDTKKKENVGEFKNVLKVRETTPLETGASEFKYYAAGIGLVQDGSLKLASHAGF